MLSPYLSSPLMLSSVEKVAFYLGIDAGQGRVNGTNSDTDAQRKARRIIISWAQSISTSFQNYCGREFLIFERTQYFDVYGQQEFFPVATPIRSIAIIENDPLGLFQGAQWTVGHENFHLSQGGYSVQMITSLLMYGQNAMRMTFSGGLAYHPVNSTFTCTTGTGEPVAGMYAYGSNSEAIGKVVSRETLDGVQVLELANFYGIFQFGDALEFMSSPYGQTIPDISCSITDIVQQSLCEAFPDLNRALEIELRYMQKHEADFENKDDGGKNGPQRREITDSTTLLGFQPETVAILDRYKRYLTGS